MTEKQRVTVDFDNESYYLDNEYWESWDNYGEEMADAINKEFNKLSEENKQLKSILFDVVEKLEIKIDPNEDTLYAVTLVVDGAMYLRIKEVIE